MPFKDKGKGQVRHARTHELIFPRALLEKPTGGQISGNRHCCYRKFARMKYCSELHLSSTHCLSIVTLTETGIVILVENKKIILCHKIRG
jgi:hypothetical protein